MSDNMDDEFMEEALNELQDEHDAYMEEAREHEQHLHEEYMAEQDINKSTHEWWNTSTAKEEMIEPFSMDVLRKVANSIRKSNKLSEHPPFYPFNTFALRDNNCSVCHDKVYAPGWYFRFLHLQIQSFMCEKCHGQTWEQFLNYKFGKNYFAIKDYITNGIGKEIISMLSKQALTN